MAIDNDRTMNVANHGPTKPCRQISSRQADSFQFIFCAALLAMAAVLLVPCSVAGKQVELRGYGKVEASKTPERSEFTCQSEGKADILLGKLLADMFWDAGTTHREKTIKVQGKDVIVHVFPPYGAIAVMRAKNRVVAVGADSEPALAEALKAERVLREPVAFSPAKPYPMYLDFYDLRAF